MVSSQRFNERIMYLKGCVFVEKALIAINEVTSLCRPRNGYVYIMQAAERVCKIGISRNDPKARLKDVNAHNWQDVRLTHILVTNNAIGIESLMHKMFVDFRIKNEWFSLSPEEILTYTNHEIGCPWEEYDPDYNYSVMADIWFRELQAYNAMGDPLELQTA